MHPTSLMLFAAGFGTRMGDLTRTRPKPLVPVAGRPLIDHALDLCQEAGIAQVVVNTHYLADQVHAHLANRRGIVISHESPDILDTGGGLRHALPWLGPGPVFSLNSDAIWTGANPLAQLLAAWRPEQMDGLLLLVPKTRAHGHANKGDFTLDAAGRLRRGPGAVYSGAQIIRTDRLDTISERAFSLNRLWDLMLTEGRLFGAYHQGCWCDVGHPGGIAQAEELLAGAGDE
ncbi:MurNAc alpha-1-phosphate uridylyltransferase [Rhodovulum bhavnagarense]|uniref:MurNAc alpha-1-phosphate uridylyltransferase n=1 Tax=Rhodovulum bhavnagarense TaxID=992286 RepID=A0A4R2RGD5_9RHOB|nr:nucleotidyltransferase family protein [Rhodovulum bhavnagarense]TCP61147.1 MurNAc alpha-1-phosphate uridylyltransferase [Rhodovulum bhavnagarense]